MSARRFVAKSIGVGVVVAMVFGAVVSADHSWGDYHWARTTSSFNLVVVNSTTAEWDPYVAAAAGAEGPTGSGWSQSSLLDLVEDPNGSTSSIVRRHCQAPDGMIRICNLAYGYNGWLGGRRHLD
jgi:hypothetical protein